MEDDSEVDSFLEDNSVGDCVAEDENVQNLVFARRVSAGCLSEVNPVSASAVEKRAGWEDWKELPCYLREVISQSEDVLLSETSGVTSEDDSVGNGSVDAESVGDVSAEETGLKGHAGMFL